ncbi:MAG: hypothetical protein IRZ04_16740 [Rhodospirillales bacterium]|nr:hypothetical protein [Rhodospirillales bacterium]
MEVYGQPTGSNGYDIIDSPIFLYWMPAVKFERGRVKHPWPSGYKVHIAPAADDAERVARALLPKLQAKRLDHKVVYPLDAYRRLNQSEQRGKFITIYPGPVLHAFTDLINAIDPLLAEMKAKPGPLPLDRQSGYSRAERRIGVSGLVSYVTTDDYRK